MAKNWIVYFHDESEFCGVMSIKEWDKDHQAITGELAEYKRYKRWERAIEVADKHSKKRYNIT